MKQLINCNTVDVNQIMPLKYHWAREHYRNGCSNHWMPGEVPMGKDVEIWRGNTLSEAERHLVMRNLGFFATAESLVANNLVLAIFQHVTNAECRQYLLRQAFEEAVHTDAFLYIVESLGLDEQKIFEMYHSIPSIKAKDDFEMKYTKGLLRGHEFPTGIQSGGEAFLENLIAFYVIMEGIFFYSGFAAILSLHRRNLMTGIGQQFQYILRDETIHMNFGIDLINGIKAENPGLWTPRFQERIMSMIMEAVELEIAYACDCLPEDITGLSQPDLHSYVCYIADRRLERIGLGSIYHSKNPFPWLSETVDLPKEKNFFETVVTEYRTGGGLSWE